MEKNKNSPLQSTCFIIYNGKLNPPVIFRFLNESFEPITLTQYHRGFWLFSLNIDKNSNENIELHISQPRNSTKFYTFLASTLSSFKFIDITQSEELVPFPDFNSFFASAIFNHKINFSFGSSDQLEDINKFLSSFINYKSDQPLSGNISKNTENITGNNINQNENLSKQDKSDNKISNKKGSNRDKSNNANINSSFHFPQDYNNNNFDKSDEYLIWALLYISCQPWYSLFQYNECFSKLLLKYITQFILKNFFLDKTETRSSDFKNSITNLDTNFNYDFDFDFSINSRKLSSYQKFKSAQPFVDTLILLIRAQLGEGIAYIVSCIFSDREEEERMITYSDLRFTLTSSVSSMSSSLSIPSSALSAEGNPNLKKRSSSFELRQTNDQINFQYAPPLFNSKDDHTDEDYIFTELSKQVRNDEDSENLFLVYLAVGTRKNKFTFKPPNLIDDEKVAKIICERLLFTSLHSSKSDIDQDLEYFLTQIPNINEVTILLSQGKYFIPFEWLTLFKKSPLFLKETVFVSLVQNSLRNSASKHLINSYAKVTSSGALFHDDSDQSNRVLQPGSILQPDVSCGKFSMMMAGSVALSGSFLIQNCYSPRNAIVLPMEGRGIGRAIDQTAVLEMPIKLKRGVTIGKNSFISKNVNIGSGTKIGDNVYVSENVRIHKGALIGDNEMIPHDCEIPIGFIYTSSVVEFAKKLPNVIRKANNSLFFYKQVNGFVDLNQVLLVSNERSFILDYFETFKDFPDECGRQIAMNCCCKSFIEIDENAIYGIFKLHSLLVALEFWKTSDKQRNQINTNENLNQNQTNKNENHSINMNSNENLNKNQNNDSSANENNNNDDEKSNIIIDENRGFEKVILNLANLAFDDLTNTNTRSQLLVIDDFLEDERVAIFVLKLAQNLSFFEEKGISSEKVSNSKKIIFELVDEVIVRMSLFPNAERKRTFQVLKTIIELTQKKNEK